MTDRYDVVIVGGGIHGVGVAQAAAARGHSVLLLEQTALAHGTSSRSSKLIHGGLRYLETMQFALVRESLRERRLLLNLAPELVRLVSFFVPVYKSTRRHAWQLRLGLSLYACLGGMTSDNRFSTVPRGKWDSLDGLDTQDLRAVFCYKDGQTDDAALTHAVMRFAKTLGAQLALPARFSAAQLEADEVFIEYQINGRVITCRARVLVNAAGPWANQVLDNVMPLSPRREVDLVRGTHIVVPGTMKRGIYYMEAPQDGRAVFVMPRPDGTALVGTTEAPYEGDPAAVQPTIDEHTYLINVLAHYFPFYRSTEHQTVLSSFAGLRVLPKGPGRAFNRTRETMLVTDREDQPRLITIYGGKLTTYRATAQKVLQRLAGSLPASKPLADTRQLPLSPD